MRPWMCIVGPTGAGKSALAMALAERRGLAIVSADSRQIYRHFNIGTGKPSHADRLRIPHYGLDVIDPQARYSAHHWATEARRWCAHAVESGTYPVIVGGTGFYISALVEPLDAMPELDPVRRERLDRWLAHLDRHELVRWCTILDPQRAHLGRTQLLRAIETALLAGLRLGDHLRLPSSANADASSARYLLVDPGDSLYVRIASRVREMTDHGFVAEVARLKQRYGPEVPAWKACGYSAMRDALNGLNSLEWAIERTIIESRQYAKRQRTWFRHQLPQPLVTRVDPMRGDILERTLAWWDAGVGSSSTAAVDTFGPMGECDTAEAGT